MIDAVAEQREKDFFAPLFSHFVPRVKAYTNFQSLKVGIT